MKEIKLEVVSPENQFVFWYENLNTKIKIIVFEEDNLKQAKEILGKFLLDLRTKKIIF